jgi:hypothetical protein
MRYALTLLLLLGCGDDSMMTPADASIDRMPDALVPDAAPGSIGAPCDQANGNADCGSDSTMLCLSDQYLLCRPGFCSKSCDSGGCPSGSMCVALPQLDATGQPSARKLCFIPCPNGSSDCAGTGLTCNPIFNVCDDGIYLWNVGSLGSRQSNGQPCDTSPPAPVPTMFGNNVPASDPTVTRPSEPHIAVDASGAIFIAYNAAGGTTVSVSTDGTTFTHHHINTAADPIDRGDPVLAIHPTTGEIWHAYLTTFTGQCGAGQLYRGKNEIHAIHSADRGVTWSQPIRASLPSYTSDQYLLDKPWLTIAPNGTVYVSFSVYDTATGASQVVLASLPAGAQAFRNIVVGSGALSGLTTDANNRLYVTWDAGGEIDYARSTDDGATATPATMIPISGQTAGEDPQLVVSHDGLKLYMAYGSTAGQVYDQEDVMLTALALASDGTPVGNWATPIKVNDDASCATHFRPTAAVDASGNLWLTWYDNRYGDGRIRWAQATFNGGLTVGMRGWATDAAPPFTTSRLQFFLGDYMGLTVANGRLYAAWGDLREVPAGGDGRIYYASGIIP